MRNDLASPFASLVALLTRAFIYIYRVVSYSRKMMSSTLMVFVSVMTLAMMSGEAFAALPAQCNPGFLEELPPRLRKICVAIARIWDAREMNDFIDDKGKK